MAWTKAITIRSGQHIFTRGDGRTLIAFELAVTSDASASGDITLSSELISSYGANEAERLMQYVRGSGLYWVNYIAGATTPTTESTITVDDENGLLLFSEAVTAAATSQGWVGTKDTTYAPLTDAIFAMTTLANTKTATVHFWFLK